MFALSYDAACTDVSLFLAAACLLVLCDGQGNSYRLPAEQTAAATHSLLALVVRELLCVQVLVTSPRA